MDKTPKDLDQLINDFDRIIELFSKMEKSSLEDVDSLKEESTLLQNELRKRYGQQDSPEADSQEA